MIRIEVILRNVVRNSGEIGVCSTCMDARGLADEALAEGTHRSTLEQLTDWTIWADRVLVY